MASTLTVSDEVLQALRARADQEKRSADEIADELLRSALNGMPEAEEPEPVYHDLDWLAGSGPLEPEVIAALEEMRVVDPRDWEEPDEGEEAQAS